jgi:hypothetical protein
MAITTVCGAITGNRQLITVKRMARGMPFSHRDVLELLGTRSRACMSAIAMSVIAMISIACSEGKKLPNALPDAAVIDAMAVDAAPVVDAPEVIDAPIPDAPTTRVVRGTATLHHVTDLGDVDAPEDLSTVPFASFTPTASGFERRAGAGAADGTFAVPVGIDALAWQLEIQLNRGQPRFFLASSAAQLDLSSFVFGRPDTRFPSQPTTVTVNATGLSPWQMADEIGIMSANAGALVSDVQTTTSPAPGATAITGHVIAWRETLIEAAKGDTAMMFQLAEKTTGAELPGYVALARSGPATGFTMVNGSPATMTVALADVPQSSRVTLHVKRSQFDALRAQVGPGALPSEVIEQSIFIHALPQLRRRGFFIVGPRLVVSFPATGTLDYDRTLIYGNPFTTGGVAWDEYAIVRYNFGVPVLAASATTPANVEVGFMGQIPIAALAADGTVAPALTPVRNVKIAGKDLATPRVDVGLTPTITWDPPSTGTPTGTPTSYLVSVRRVTANGTATAVLPIATFRTTSTSLQLPDAVLSTGASYMLVIDANAIPDYDHAAPFTSGGLPNFFATCATAQFTP